MFKRLKELLQIKKWESIEIAIEILLSIIGAITLAKTKDIYMPPLLISLIAIYIIFKLIRFYKIVKDEPTSH